LYSCHFREGAGRVRNQLDIFGGERARVAERISTHDLEMQLAHPLGCMGHTECEGGIKDTQNVDAIYNIRTQDRLV
jgi:hypothetical protein